MPKKISKSDVPIEEQKKEQETTIETLARILSTPQPGKQPGDGCTIVINGEKHRGRYTEEGWEYDT